ncbi:MAG: hypothetical protein ACR2N6_08620 [Miltoncostaeaceae bacterium]
MAAALIVLAIATLIIVAAAALPLLSGGGGDEDWAAEDRRRRIQEDLDRSLAAIREIEHDHATGNLSDEDFETLDRTERARAVELIKRRDALTAGEAE